MGGFGISKKQNTSGLILKDKNGNFIKKVTEILLDNSLTYDEVENILGVTGNYVSNNASFFTKSDIAIKSNTVMSNLSTSLHGILPTTSGQYVQDGGQDIYDNGNRITVNNVIKNYQLANDIVNEDSVFVNNGVILYQENLPFLESFIINGNYGSDGNTNKVNYSFTLNIDNTEIAVFVQDKRGGDPSTCTVMYVKGYSDTDFTFNDPMTRDNYSLEVRPVGTINTETVIGNITLATNSGFNNNFTQSEIQNFMNEYLKIVL